MAAIRKEFKWAWLKPCGTAQDDVFDTPDAAIKEMRNRMGWENSLEELMINPGIRLAMVKITVEPVAALNLLRQVDA